MPPKKGTNLSQQEIDRVLGRLSQQYGVDEEVIEQKLKQLLLWNDNYSSEDEISIYDASKDDLELLSQSFGVDKSHNQFAIKASESVVSATKYDRVKHQSYVEYRLKSGSDRAPSPFNGTDGDHRTAIE